MSDVIYDRPPITEAVIGINFAAPLSDKELSDFSAKLNKLYPELQVISNYSVVITGKTINNHPVAKDDSYRLTRDNSTQIVVLSKSSFLLSQLAPYQGWNNLFDRFVESWSIKTRSLGFKEISRIGVRYINRIDIPIKENQIEYEDYLNVYPFIPKSLGNLNSYAIQVSLPLDKIQCNLLINSAVVNSPMIDHVSFIIDSDISRAKATPQSDEDIFNLLKEIRVEKNIVFEDCITDNARKLFNHV